MISRQALYDAWWRFYARLPIEVRKATAESYCRSLEGRMRFLGSFQQSVFHGYRRLDLARVLGMAYGVHKQFLAGLTFYPQRGHTERVAGGSGPQVLGPQVLGPQDPGP